MKALTYEQYGGPEVLTLTTVDTPEPAAGEIRVRVHAVAVSTADAAFRLGQPFAARLAAGVFRPRHAILGTEFSGVVDAVGNGVTRFKTGDAVYAASGTNFGAHAQFVCLSAEGAVEFKPASLDFIGAAAVCEGGLTALPFLRDGAKLKAGERILINGASGSVGSAAVQIAKHFGAEVTAVCRAENHAMVKALGADHTIDYRDFDFTTMDERWDVVFDAVGKSSFARSKGVLNPGGRYFATTPSFGIFWAMAQTACFGDKRAGILFAGLRKPHLKAADLRELRTLVEAGALRPVLGGTFTVSEAHEAHRLADSGHKKGSAILTF
jgi:NADPH:quinone reductase-like Zn-dependent oxidoreductase